MIRDGEKTAVSGAEERLERLEQEINDLRRRNAELEQLSHTEDHIHFLQVTHRTVEEHVEQRLCLCVFSCCFCCVCVEFAVSLCPSWIYRLIQLY